MTLPAHVDYGSLMSLPPPYVSLDTTMWGFWVRADEGKLDALCRRLFAEPSGGEIDIRPLGPWLMLTWGNIATVHSQTEPFASYGGVAEPQVSVWVPAARVRPDGDRLRAEHFAMWVPYLWLDNAMSLATGREVFGYPKAWGWPEFPAEGGEQRWGLDVFGLDYGPGQQAARHPLLEVVEPDVGAVDEAEQVFETVYDLARDAARRLFSAEDDRPVVPGIRFVAEVARDVLARRMPQVFLKQVRDIADVRGAALQQICETAYHIDRLAARPLLDRHRLTVNPLDSHPVGEELGLASQDVEIAYRVEMDFTVQTGSVLWDARGA